jgi:hypothetical protein
MPLEIGCRHIGQRDIRRGFGQDTVLTGGWLQSDVDISVSEILGAASVRIRSSPGEWLQDDCGG